MSFWQVNHFYKGAIDMDGADSGTNAILKPGAGPLVGNLLDIDIEHGATVNPLPEASWFRSGPIPDWAKTACIVSRFEKTVHTSTTVNFTAASCNIYVRSLFEEPEGSTGAFLRHEVSGHVGPYVSDLNTNQSGAGISAGGSTSHWLRNITTAGGKGDKHIMISASNASSMTQVCGLPPAKEFLWSQLLDFGGNVATEEVFEWETWCVFGK